MLCHCGSVWQEGFIKDLEKKRAVVDMRIEEGEEPAFVPSLASLQTKQTKNVLESVVQGSLFKQEGTQRKPEALLEQGIYYLAAEKL